MITAWRDHNWFYKESSDFTEPITQEIYIFVRFKELWALDDDFTERTHFLTSRICKILK
jgi:hypothetical protein